MMDIADYIAKLQFGTISGWALVAMGLIAWWRGLPRIIEAITNRQSKVEERLGKEMDAMSKRWEERLNAADRRHAECEKGQEELRKRVEGQDTIITTQNNTIAKQSETIVALSNEVAGLRASNMQAQIALVEDADPSEAMNRALTTLKRIK